MSLIIQYDQETKEFRRLLFYDNNISEILESHGGSFIETMAYVHKKKNHIHPFYILPTNYSKIHFHKIEKVYKSFECKLDQIAEQKYEPCLNTIN